MSKRIIKWGHIIGIIVAICFVGLQVVAISSMFDVGNGNFYSKEDLIANYKSKTNELYQLKDFYNGLVPKDKIVEIEFENNKKIARLAVTNLNSTSKNYSERYFCAWDLPVNSYEVDSVLQRLGWTKETIMQLKSRLDKAGCIGIINGEPTNISFQRSGLGMYSYELFSNPISDSLKSKYNDTCHYIFYNNRVVLEYGGGAVGPQCFPKQRK
jgi:hypothetical protein